MKLNLGCGFKKYDGYINVDVSPAVSPDIVVDLEKTPWPWEDSSVDEIKLEHTLEHLGQTSQQYLDIWKELWRVGKNGCVIDIMVPHWNHENFYHDPTHVRAITPVGVAMFDQTRNIKDAGAGGRESKLGLITGIDISLSQNDIEYGYGPAANAVNRGEITREQLAHLSEHQNNIIIDIRMKARVVKPGRGASWLATHGSRAYAESALHRALALKSKGAFEESETLAAKLPLSLPGVKHLYGWHLVRRGRFREGFAMMGPELGIYRSDDFYNLPKEKMLQPGIDVSGKTILLALEGGFGDEVAWARFSQTLHGRGARVIVGTDPRSEAPLKRLLGADETRRIDRIASHEYDYYLLAMSSADVLNINDPSQEIAHPYLTASDVHREKIRPGIEAAARGRLKIGIQWQGNAQYEPLEHKSFPASLLLPFSEQGQLFSLQRNAGENTMPEGAPVVALQTGPSDWEHTLAAIAEMDVIVSGCTSIAHYAGAIGKPTLIIANIAPSYYWADLKPETRWYPSVRIFRQPKPGDWESALKAARAHLSSSTHSKVYRSCCNNDRTPYS